MAKQKFDDLFGSVQNTQASGAFPVQTIIQQIVKKAKSRYGVVPLDRLRPNPHQPRQVFDEQGLQELGDSIVAKGLLQPLVIRESPIEEGMFDIAAGERRWRAMQLKGIKEAEALILDAVCTNEEMEEIAVVENVQRSDLTPLELAHAYLKLHKDREGHVRNTIVQVAQIVKKDPNYVDDHLAILRAPEQVRQLIIDDPHVPLRTIRDLSNVPDEADRDYLVGEVRARRLTANDISNILRELRQEQKKKGSQQESGIEAPPSSKRPSSTILALKTLERKLHRAHTTIDREFRWISEEVASMSPSEKERVRQYAEQLLTRANELLHLTESDTQE